MSFKVLLDGAAETIEREVNRVRNATNKADSAGDNSSTTGKTKVRVEVS